MHKKIKGFEEYTVTKTGDVYSHKNGKKKKLKPENNHGYLRVALSSQGRSKKFRIHRLVAMSFINNKNNHKCVNHLDGNKKNNCVENLEWCSFSDNQKHSYRVLGRKVNKTMLGKTKDKHHNSIPTIIINLKNGRKQNFVSRRECAKFMGVSDSMLVYAIKNKCLIKSKFKIEMGV